MAKYVSVVGAQLNIKSLGDKQNPIGVADWLAKQSSKQDVVTYCKAAGMPGYKRTLVKWDLVETIAAVWTKHQ